ncbi:AAA family ATPase [Patescibacteria group bacterium]|nr:AAA family ATPase [Patescibacteria group bacterium]MDL1952796.1 hypothetical protein [Candidatus Uhrbacteria bacterium UHB]RIL01032.1 MAG: hypothetical protein DCC77_00625 [Candidatus Uhrbacteria bacterium]
MRSAYIIGLIGTNASGKTYAADYIVRTYGGVHITFSDYLARALEAMNMEKSKQNMIKMSIAIRKEFGEEALSRAVAHDVERMEEQLMLVDGIRRTGDLERFKTMKRFRLVGIDADPKIRFTRMRGRREKSDDRNTAWEEFLEKENAPTEITIPEVMKQADYRIDNNGTTKELEQKIDGILADLGIQKYS